MSRSAANCCAAVRVITKVVRTCSRPSLTFPTEGWVVTGSTTIPYVLKEQKKQTYDYETVYQFGHCLHLC
jgi:hypothetical protein